MLNSKYPRIEISKIDKLGISFKQGVAKISFEAPMPGPELLKLIYMQAKRQPMIVIFESPQAQMDLIITPVVIKSGEAVGVLSEVSGDVKD